jgi:hypothetical protein
MPVVSQAQNRYVRWVEIHPEQAKAERGMTPVVAKHFVDASHGERVRDLPARKASGGCARAASYQRATPW